MEKLVSIESARRTATPLMHAASAARTEKFVHLLKSTRRALRPRGAVEDQTSFFRDFKPFELLRRSILPKLIELKREDRELTIWSAASSSGQEAYSLAMMLCEDFPEVVDWNVKIIATDISQPLREYAANGRYRRMEVNCGLPARMLLKYFEREGDEWQISPEVRSMVSFESADLCSPISAPRKFDLVLLRNVLLYFSQHDRTCVLTDVHRAMFPHGALLMGNGEQAEDSTDLFDGVVDAGCFYYRPTKRNALLGM